jgi:uroporphyrinogen-III decarboxylase
MLAAVRHRAPDRIPVDTICVENAPAIAAYLGCPEEEVIDRLGLDGRGVGPAYLGAPPLPPSPAGRGGQGGEASPPLDELCFFGGINTQRLPFVTPEQVREETLRCIEALGEGGGYICGPDHHLKPDVPGANAVALFETARGYRRPAPARRSRRPDAIGQPLAGGLLRWR